MLGAVKALNVLLRFRETVERHKMNIEVEMVDIVQSRDVLTE